MVNFKNIHFNQAQETNVLSQKILTKLFDRVLDLGCGGGTLLSLIAQKSQFHPRFICGLDLSLKKLKQAQSAISNGQFVCADAISLPFIDSSIDLVVSSNLMEHIPEDYGMLSEVYRVLSKKGLFYLETILSSGHGIYIYRKNNRFVLDPTHIHEYSSQAEVCNLFKRAGFRVIEVNIALVSYSICDLILRILHSFNILSDNKIHNIYQKYKVLRLFRHSFKIIIPGWYFIRILAVPEI